MVSAVLTLVVVLLGVIILRFTRFLSSGRKRSHPLPPGPKPWPVVGNISDMPRPGFPEWEHWLKHNDLYGPISSVTVMGTNMVLLHSARLALELLEKRSAIYSSRPRMVFGGEMCGWENMTAIIPYGNHLRAHRKCMFAVLGTKSAVARFCPLQNAEVKRFLLRILGNPQDIDKHALSLSGAIILKLTYGYTIELHTFDPLVDLADRLNEQFAAATVPGAWLVDVIPALRYLPNWMPGAGFKKTAKIWKATLLEFVDKPNKFVHKRMAQGDHKPSFVSSLYEQAGDLATSDEEDLIKWSAVSLYAAGADTSGTTVTNFFLAMLLYPEVQVKAREEIDRVIGTHRLPTFDDRQNLPYIETVVTEAFRWHPVGPLGVPRVATEDDICDGYFIPKGALVIANIWWFTHDPESYPNPESFNPSCYVGPDPCPDPRDFVFGFGRRTCPAMLLGESSVWLAIACTLAVFDIAKPVVAETGEVIEPEARFTAGTVSQPFPFQASIKPRSAGHEALIRQADALKAGTRSDSEDLPC
ncbi:cytochrome P450 [Daldinia decipiens]|uniref:cytochrome P450 n=1 Tax=Daldinia decipiens TaxID=326647 RepID=UPI0020C35533|nr:cytochrome P450 [Daldinia decipiens]KAI1658689.1 cytochrome P450 [Daldinia decipiens]